MRTVRLATLLALALLAGALLAGCAGPLGTGALATETRAVRRFHAVAVSGMGDLRIDQNGTEGLTIEARNDGLPLLESQVEGGRLLLGPRAGTQLQSPGPITYRLSVQALDAIRKV